MEEIKKAEVKQFVVFSIGDEEYGIDIHNVTTIEYLLSIARVPKTPEYLKGVINLRGEIIPVFDLRKKFGFPEVEPTEETRIIILKVGEFVSGVIVDIVSEVIEPEESSIESSAGIITDIAMDYIWGVGKTGDRFITLLNLDKLIRIKED